MKRKLSFFIVVLCVTCTISKAQTTSIVVMEDKTPYGMQTYFSSGNGGLQTSEIKSYWDQNYYITSVAYGSFGWFVTMSQGTGWTDQSYSYRNRWPDDWVQQQKSAGNYITSLASSENMWLVVTSANSDYSAQEICAAPWSSLKEWIGRRGTTPLLRLQHANVRILVKRESLQME